MLPLRESLFDFVHLQIVNYSERDHRDTAASHVNSGIFLNSTQPYLMLTLAILRATRDFSDKNMNNNTNKSDNKKTPRKVDRMRERPHRQAGP